MDACAIGLRPGSEATHTLGGTRTVQEDVTGIRVQRLQIKPSSAVKSINFRFARSLAAHVALGQTDVVQLLQMSPWGLGGLLSIRRKGVPIVYTETMMPDPSLARPIRAFHWRLPFKLLSALVVSSTAMRDAAHAVGIDRSIDVIPNGVDLTRFRPVDAHRRAELRERLGLPASSPVILFVGGFLSKRKGIDVLAEAWPLIEQRYPDAHLVLVGPDRATAYQPAGPQEAFLEDVHRRLAPSEQRGQVVFAGSVANVEEYFQAADVFVFPSRKEGMPNVIPEACACGTPIVLTAFEGLSPEMGMPGETFELVEREGEAIAERVITLLDDGQRRIAMAEAARVWVEERMDVERSVDAYAQLYRRVAGRSGA